MSLNSSAKTVAQHGDKSSPHRHTVVLQYLISCLLFPLDYILPNNPVKLQSVRNGL